MDLPGAGSVISQKYRLERQLGQGGMGQVWVARHLQLDTLVAVKLLVPERAESADFRRRLEREAKAAASVRHPNIVQVFDHGADGETHYLVMELLEGEDLETRLQSKGPLDIDEAIALVTSICKGLQRIHDAGLVHRDLKPSNVFLEKQGAEQVVKILDFGIAKAMGVVQGGDVTTTGVVVGSLPYVSPEQLLKEPSDHRTDLWSLGVLVFRAVTGSLPFSSQAAQLVVEICTAPVPLASSMNASLPPGIDAFFERAICREPEQRFQSASQLAEAFAALAGSAGAARPAAETASRVEPPVTETPRRGALRPAVIALLAGAAAVIALRLAGVIGGTDADEPSRPVASAPVIAASTSASTAPAPTTAPVEPRGAAPAPAASDSSSGATAAAPPVKPRAAPSVAVSGSAQPTSSAKPGLAPVDVTVNPQTPVHLTPPPSTRQ